MTEKLWARLTMRYITKYRYYLKNSHHVINATEMSPLLQNSYLVKHWREFEGRTVQSGTGLVITLLDFKAFQVHHSEKIFQEASEHNFTEQPGEQHKCIPFKKKGYRDNYSCSWLLVLKSTGSQEERAFSWVIKEMVCFSKGNIEPQNLDLPSNRRRVETQIKVK